MAANTRKSIEDLQADADSHGLSRTLGPLHLVLFGIGCILGAGIYVLPGTAAANFAGPAVMISFVIAGTACALTALCYAELASTMPVSGSSYSYCYASLGEVFAWSLGWILMLEYTLASSTLAVGFSSYLTSLLRSFDIVVPAYLATPLVGTDGGFSMNLVAVLAIVVVTARALRRRAPVRRRERLPRRREGRGAGVVISVGVGAIDPGNWKPFVPPHEGEFRIRLARHRARRLDPLLRVPRVRDRFDGGVGIAQSAARHADRNSRRAGRLHGALPRGRRRADRRRAVPRARGRRSGRPRGRPDGAPGRRDLRQGRRADGPRIRASRQRVRPVAHHVPDVAGRHAPGRFQPRARAVPHALSRDHPAGRRFPRCAPRSSRSPCSRTW